MSCSDRHAWPTTRSQPAGHARCAARRRQRGARRPAPAAQPVGDEPGAGAAARDDRRSAAGAGRARSRSDAARARTARAGRPAGRDAEAVLRPAEKLDLARLVRTFTLRHQRRLRRELRPGAHRPRRPRGARRAAAFRHKPDKDSTPLRDGTVDLETGVIGTEIGPEVRTQALFRDRFIGVVRTGHPLSRARGSGKPAMRPAGTSSSRAAASTGPDRRRLAGGGDQARDRHHRRRLRDRAGAGPGFRPDRHRSRTPHPAAARRHAAVSRCPLPCPRSRCRCSGTRAWMPIRRIAGCAAASARPAPAEAWLSPLRRRRRPCGPRSKRRARRDCWRAPRCWLPHPA